MKINSMKFTIVILQLLLVMGIMAGLFFIEIPAGNREVAYVLLGAISTNLVTSISNLFRRPQE